jgi:GTP-binding protein HflX
MELFDRKQQSVDDSQQALLIYTDIYNKNDNGKGEFLELANSTGIEIFNTLTLKISTPKAAHFIGTGKVEELREMVEQNNLNMVIFSNELTPSQERNLEKALGCQVLDRVGLILDIFAIRARSFEGKLQVELAQLKHLSTRLVKGWSHLERQKGGIGLRGPGETQLETDRRLIGMRIKSLNKKLDKVEKRRELGRKSRTKNELPMITLAGYTNAGKSTLFNALTSSDIYADDRLFATLDATIRKVILPASGKAVIADTVGFINDLPQDLIQAFKSTLEESIRADVLLHIIDSSDENSIDKQYQVESILREIGADKVPVLLVMNKIDKLDDFAPKIDRDENGIPYRVWVSSIKNQGIELLHEAISEKLSGIISKKTIYLEPFANYIRSQIYDIGYVKSEKFDEVGGTILDISVTKHYLDKILNMNGVSVYKYQLNNK